jgi:hypothetical protein
LKKSTKLASVKVNLLRVELSREKTNSKTIYNGFMPCLITRSTGAHGIKILLLRLNQHGDAAFVAHFCSLGKVCFLKPSTSQISADLWGSQIGRLEHIGEHYEKEHLDISQWSHSLTIKGLLRQPNIQQEWKDLVKSHGDNNLGWLREDAEDLKRKLEFGEGKPRSLALEALKLAKILDKDGIPSTADSFWKSRARRSSTLQDPNEAVDKEWRQKPAVPSLCLPGIAQVMESYSPWNLHLVDGTSRCSGDTTMIGPLPDVEMQDIISNYNV